VPEGSPASSRDVGAAERAWSIRPATAHDRSAILQLMQRAFGPEQQPEQHWLQRWDWIFLKNTADLPMYYLVADAGERLSGQYAMMPVRLQHEGKPVLGLLSLDTATSPDFARQGVFTTLAKQLYESAATEAPIVFGFPNANSAPGFYRRLDWVELQPFPLLIRPLGNARALLRAWQPRLAPLTSPIAFLTPLLRVFEHAVRLASERGPSRVRTLENFSGWADDLWDELSPDLGTCAVRDAAYLNWRFCSSPYAYRRYALHRGAGPVGFAVTTLHPWRVGKIAYLMELMAPKSDGAGARLLLAHALLDAAREGATAIVTVATRRHPHRRAMLQSGFFPAPKPLKEKGSQFSFGVRQNGPSVVPNKLFHVDDWYISGADFDSV
jgi:predicted N-acetyltransferase YhbS